MGGHMFFIHIRVILFLFILSILTLSCTYKPNNQTHPPPFSIVTFDHLFGVAAPDDNNIWIVGLNATILHSKDGGKSWIRQKSPLTADLYDVWFADNRNGWVVGKYGTILRTGDGGATWITARAETDQRLFDVCFADVQSGWSVGSWGTIVHTSNGGETWTKQGPGEDIIYNGVWFVDTRQGWIVGEYGTILHTQNGGKTWMRQECKDIIPVLREDEWETPTPSLYGVYFKDPLQGWAVGLDGIIIHTQDGGKKWKQLDSPAEFALYKIMVIGNNGWAVGLRGGYVFSTDDGRTWTMDDQSIRTRFWLRDLCFCDKAHGCLVGSSGTIALTQNGGETWQMVSGISFGQ